MSRAKYSMLLSAGVLSLAISHATFTAEAESVPDLSGHWQSTAGNSQAAMGIEMDIARNSDGDYYGTMSQADQNLKGLPLIDIIVEDEEITFLAREDQPLVGTLSEDGQTFTGAIYMMSFQIPVTMTRSGEAQFPAPVISEAVDQRFTGEWQGNMGGNQIAMTVNNRTDGTASAEMVLVSQGGLRIPVAKITTSSSQLQLDVSAVGGSFTGELSSDGLQIAGYFQQGTSQSPLNFQKSN